MSKRKIPTIVKKVVDDSHYYYVDGDFFPSVTTILGEAAPFPKGLRYFYKNNTARQIDGILEETGSAGSLVHACIETLLLGKVLDMTKLPSDIKASVSRFYDWYEIAKPISCIPEHTVASVKYKYAGTLDLACKIDKKGFDRLKEAGCLPKKFKPSKEESICLIDFKNTSGIYFNHKLQLRAYQHAFEEMYGVSVDHIFILRVGTRHKIGFEFKEVFNQTFKDFLRVYKIYKTIHGGKIPPPPVIEEYPDRLKLNNLDVNKEVILK